MSSGTDSKHVAPKHPGKIECQRAVRALTRQNALARVHWALRGRRLEALFHVIDRQSAGILYSQISQVLLYILRR